MQPGSRWAEAVSAAGTASLPAPRAQHPGRGLLHSRASCAGGSSGVMPRAGCTAASSTHSWSHTFTRAPTCSHVHSVQCREGLWVDSWGVARWLPGAFSWRDGAPWEAVSETEHARPASAVLTVTADWSLSAGPSRSSPGTGRGPAEHPPAAAALSLTPTQGLGEPEGRPVQGRGGQEGEGTSGWRGRARSF